MLLWDPWEGMGVYKGMFLGLLKVGHILRKIAESLEEKASILELAGESFLLYFDISCVIFCCLEDIYMNLVSDSISINI